jgi:hypothetical protein
VHGRLTVIGEVLNIPVIVLSDALDIDEYYNLLYPTLKVKGQTRNHIRNETMKILLCVKQYRVDKLLGNM